MPTAHGQSWAANDMPRRRRTKKTRLVYCEGAHDRAFLECIKSVYSSEVYTVDVRRGAGGDQPHLVEAANKKGRAYDQAFLKVDGDRDLEEMATADSLAEELKVILLRTKPCLEALLITILEPNKRIGSWNAARLKRYFQETYIPESKRTDARAYSAVFTKQVLDEARGRLAELDALVRLFQ